MQGTDDRCLFESIKGEATELGDHVHIFFQASNCSYIDADPLAKLTSLKEDCTKVSIRKILQ